jgi:hypothetical protein
MGDSNKKLEDLKKFISWNPYPKTVMNNTIVENAYIKEATLGIAGSGSLRCVLTVGFRGGEAQHAFSNFHTHGPHLYGDACFTGHHLRRIMEIAGVSEWSKLEGRPIRVESTPLGVRSIGHYLEDDWYCPREELELRGNQ